VAPPPQPAVAWNEELKGVLEEHFAGGVGKGVGRHLYGEIDTALATHKGGEWRVGPNLTKDGQAVVFKVANGRLFVLQPDDKQAAEWKLTPRAIDRQVDADFRLRHLDLLRLTADGPVTVTAGPGDRMTVTLRLGCEVKDSLPLESVNLIVEAVIKTADGKEGTTQIYHQPKWDRPPSGPQVIEFTQDRHPSLLRPGFTVRVSVDAFVTAPRPGRYRISNELNAKLVVK
jgi:hypothetical protein